MKILSYLGGLVFGCLFLSHAFATDLTALPAPLNTVTQDYLIIQDKLASDEFEGITATAQAMQSVQPVVKTPPFPATWAATVTAMVKAPDIHAARLADQNLSAALIAALAMAKAHTGTLHVVHCPMVKADWIQLDGTAVHNPYFGTSMPDCGSFTTVY